MIYRMMCLSALLVGFAAFVGCSHGPAKAKRGARVERHLKLEVVEPARKRIQRRLDLAATVEAMKKVDIAARVSGVVKTLDNKMDIGQHVKEGEVMLVLSVPDLDAEIVQKQALLKQAEKMKRLARENWDVAVKEVEENKKENRKYEADVEFSRSRLARITKLVKENAQNIQVQEEAKQQLEAARAAMAANEARTVKREAKVQAAIAEYELSEQRIKVAEADLGRVKEMISFATVRAPFDGVITRRTVDPGATIKDLGTVLFTFMQMDRVRILIDVPQRDVALLNAREQNPNPDGKGDAVTVTIPALSQSASRGQFTGTITRVSRSLDPVTRTMRAEIELPNPTLDLRPGMFGSASVLVEDHSEVLVIPASALVRKGEGLVEVYVVTDPIPTGEGTNRRGILRTKPVLLGIDDGKEVEIREGLKGDELVVARFSGSMRANDVVIAVNQVNGDR